MVSFLDSWDFGDGGCSFRPCLQPAIRLKQHTPPFKASLLPSKCKCKFLSVGKSIRLWPMIFIYSLLFLFFEEQSLVLLCNPRWSQASSIPLAAASSAVPGGSHHKCFTITCVFLSFQFISPVFATSLPIQHNFPHPNKHDFIKNKHEPKYSQPNALRSVGKTAFLKFSP